MPRVERDPRPLHDQIIAHDLVGKSAEQVMALIVIELRRMREDLAAINEIAAALHQGRTQV